MVDKETKDSGVGERTPNSLLEADQRSVDILRNLQDSSWFSQDPKDSKSVLLYYQDSDHKGLKPDQKLPVEDLFRAVDYYQQNRCSESGVALAMSKPDGVVDVYSPYIKGEERRVVVSIRNYMVPQILEFAYLLARSAQAKK